MTLDSVLPSPRSRTGVISIVYYVISVALLCLEIVDSHLVVQRIQSTVTA
jgi:hypothetical protein